MSQIVDSPALPQTEIARPRTHISRHHLLVGSTLLVIWGVLCRALSGEWSVNEQYAYGWFVPFFAVYLFWLRWERRPDPNPAKVSVAKFVTLFVTASALLLLLPVRLFEIASPDWRVLGWLHTAIVVSLTMLLLWRAGGEPWLRHFAFPIMFFFVAVPWILTVEAPVVLGLMRGVAAAASETLTLLGIPARVEGAVIHTNNGVVGVNEACSGVRSLQTSLMIALLLGELRSLTASRRIALVVGAVAIALFANFGRSFFLVYMAATRDLNAVERWHDTAGYSIVVVVLVGCLGLTSLLARGRSRADEPLIQSRAPVRFAPVSWFVTVLCCALFIEAGVEAWFRWHEARAVPQPRWTVHWPSDKPGYRTIPIDEHSKRDLRFDEGGEVGWQQNTSSSDARAWFMFFFRWKPGEVSILRARGHRPEFCLPNAGWQKVADHGYKFYTASADFSLPLRHYTFERGTPNGGQYYAETFSCVYEDRATAILRGPNGIPPEGLAFDGIRGFPRLVREGVRNPGQQVLELVIMSKRRSDPRESESQITALLPRIVTVEDSAQATQTSR